MTTQIFDDVSLIVNGVEHKGWQSVVIRKSVDALASSFQLQMAYERFGDRPDVHVGANVQILINGSLVITGAIDAMPSTKSATDHTRTVIGRSLTRNVVDCSVYLKTNQIDKSTPLQIAQRICAPLGVDVINEAGALLPIPIFRWADAARCGDVIQDACRQQGLTVRDNEFGQIVITRPRERVSRGSVQEGDGSKGGSVGNIEGWRVMRSEAQRFSDYFVKGRTTQSDARPGNQVRGEAKDDGVSSFRPLIIQAEGDMTNAKCKIRAVHEAQRRAAIENPVSVTVAGWRYAADGNPWRVDEVLRVSIPTESYDSSLLIKSLSFEKSDGGTHTVMDLVDPAAYEALPDTKSSSGSKVKFDPSKYIKDLGPRQTVADIGAPSVT